jgi:glycopeptide antibiotics resistance protein
MASKSPRLTPGVIAGGIALAILYGSFYPFGFYAHHDPRGPLGVLLGSGFRFYRDDVVANILLYIPFGFFVAYALEKRIVEAMAIATLAGFGLSLFVELMQFYDFGRVQAIADICSNTLGAMLGACAAVAARRRVSDIFLALLLVCWFGSRCYPAVPPSSSILALDLFRYFAAWLAVGLMMEGLLGAPRSRVALPLLLAASLLLRTFTAYWEPAEIAGGVAAAALWSGYLWRGQVRGKIVAALFVALVVLLALAPFHFSTSPRAFGWVPFRSFLESPPAAATRVFFEKAFLYGGMIWLMVRAGLSLGASAALGGMLVFGVRLLQVYLPARSAEITDAVLLLMLAGMMKLVALGSAEERAMSR